MKYDRLYNFISPVTGKLPIDRGYILLGDKNGRSFTSPVLIDVRQDIIDLKRKIGNFEELKKLDHNRIWIGDYYNEASSQLHIGIINLPPLAEAVFPNPISGLSGDFRIPNPTFDYLSPFDWVMSGPFLPQIYATSYDTEGNPTGTNISSSLAMTQVRAAQIMKRFDNASFIVGSSVVNFEWENPKMALIPEPLKQLYGLGTTYTFNKAQSLGALETGLLKNTVNDGTGTLSKAISGEDYVNTADIPIGNLVILDPLYPLAGHKLIAPTGFSTRGNYPNEFGYPIADTITILTGIAAKFTSFSITGIAINSLIKIDEFGELKQAIPDIDYVQNTTFQNLVSTVTAVNSLLTALQTAYDLFVVTTTTKDTTQDAEIAAINVKDVAQDASIAAAEATALAAEASAVATAAELETQIAVLAGVETISALASILAWAGLSANTKNYAEYVRGQTLNVKNKWKSADLNDEGHNAVGDFEFRYPTGYSSDDRGHSTLWFDSDGRNSSHKSEAGLRLFSWDSGGDHIGFDYHIAPLHIGLFGYQNKYNISPIPNPTPKYKGFIFSIPEFHNESSSDDYYRFPKKFGLYDVTRTIGTLSASHYGWDHKETIFEYDYNHFNFYKKVLFKEHSTFEKDVRITSTGALKISSGSTIERPSNAELGMIRYNTDSDIEGLEIYNGVDWNKLNSDGVKSITAGTGLSGGTITETGTISLSDNIECPGNLTINSGYLVIPVGPTSERPINPVIGMIRINTDDYDLLTISYDDDGNLIATIDDSLLLADYIIYDWRLNDISIAVVNMPFKEVNSTKDYSTYNNSGMESVADRPVWVNNDINRPNGIFTFYGNSGKEIYGYQNIIHGADSRSVAIWAKVKSNQNSFFELGNNTNQFGIHTYNNRWYVDGGNDFDTGISYNANWNFHVITYTGNYVKWYINGTYRSGGSRTFDNSLPLTGNVSFIIGHRAGITNTSFPLNGSVDNFQLFNRVLSAEQIALMYSCGQKHYYKLASQELNYGKWYCVATPVYNGVAAQSIISNTIIKY
jgi:hypothetical protein